MGRCSRRAWRSATTPARFRWDAYVGRIARAAGALRRQGLAPGERFGILARNSVAQALLINSGYWTAVLAEELGADWSRVKIEFSSTTPPYRNPRINWQFTGNSESTTGFFELLRTMGASTREMLIMAAANRWRVKADECFTDNGKVIHKPTGRSLKFGEVAEDAARVTPPANPTPKPESEWKLLGTSLARVDLPAKLDGSAVFGLDFSVPGMVCAAVKQSPVHGGGVASFDKSSVMNLPGVIDVVPIPNGVAVVARQYWQAEQALKSLKVTYDDGPNGGFSDASLNAQYRAALDGTAWKTVKSEGDAASGEVMKSKFASVYSQEYESQFLAHATMEPMNCTAHVTEDGCAVWGPIQGNQLAQVALAAALKLPPEKVTVNRTLLGGDSGAGCWWTSSCRLLLFPAPSASRCGSRLVARGGHAARCLSPRHAAADNGGPGSRGQTCRHRAQSRLPLDPAIRLSACGHGRQRSELPRRADGDALPDPQPAH